MGQYDNNFLQDYSGINAAGSAVQGFVKGLNDYQDRDMKKQEFEAKMKAMQTQADRDALNQKLEQSKEQRAQQDQQLKIANSGYEQGDDGGFVEKPFTDRQKDQMTLTGKEKGIGTTFGENGRPTYSYDPDSPQSISAHAKEYSAEHKPAPGATKPADWQKFSDALDPNKARGGNLAATQKLINSTDRIHGLFEQFPDGNIPAAQTTELATAVAGLISGGSPQSQHQIDEIVPQSAAGNAQKMISWLMDQPKGLQQQKFIQTLRESSQRERDIAIRQKGEAQRSRLTAFENLKAADPDRYQRMLDSFGVTEGPPPGTASAHGLVGGGLTASPPGLMGAPQQQDPDAVKAAKLWNMPYDQAKVILDKRKAGQ